MKMAQVRSAVTCRSANLAVLMADREKQTAKFCPDQSYIEAAVAPDCAPVRVVRHCIAS